jgi:hypothetical protein
VQYLTWTQELTCATGLYVDLESWRKVHRDMDVHMGVLQDRTGTAWIGQELPRYFPRNFYGVRNRALARMLLYPLA